MDEQQENFKQFTVSLQELIECPVCFGTMDPNLKQCINGHGVCSDCERKIDKCPSCEQKFTIRHNTLLSQILERLPKLCLYSDHGCNTVVFGNEHHRFCEFRPFNCLNKSCKWKGYVRDLLEHVQECYDDNELCQITSLNISQQTPLTLNESEDGPQKTPIIFQDQLFYICTFKSMDIKPGKIVILYRFYHIPTSKPTCNFYLSAHFTKGKIKFKLTYKAKPVTFPSEIRDKVGDDGIDDIDGIIVMGESDLRKFVFPWSDDQYEYTLELDSEDIRRDC